MNHPEKCPFCGSGHTCFGDSYSDGEERIERPFHCQQCVNRKCGLSCKFWEPIGDMLVELKRAGMVSYSQDAERGWYWSTTGESLFKMEQ